MALRPRLATGLPLSRGVFPTSAVVQGQCQAGIDSSQSSANIWKREEVGPPAERAAGTRSTNQCHLLVAFANVLSNSDTSNLRKVLHQGLHHLDSVYSKRRRRESDQEQTEHDDGRPSAERSHPASSRSQAIELCGRTLAPHRNGARLSVRQASMTDHNQTAKSTHQLERGASWTQERRACSQRNSREGRGGR